MPNEPKVERTVTLVLKNQRVRLRDIAMLLNAADDMPDDAEFVLTQKDIDPVTATTTLQFKAEEYVK